jgi:hypothetical protein
LLNAATIKIISIVGAILVAVALLGTGYRIAYNHGKLSAQSECTETMAKYQKDVQAKIDTIETDLGKIASIAEIREDQLSSDIAKILAGVKKKPVTIIKEGKCTPSTSFTDSINEAITRANSK